MTGVEAFYTCLWVAKLIRCDQTFVDRHCLRPVPASRIICRHHRFGDLTILRKVASPIASRWRRRFLTACNNCCRRNSRNARNSLSYNIYLLDRLRTCQFASNLTTCDSSSNCTKTAEVVTSCGNVLTNQMPSNSAQHTTNHTSQCGAVVDIAAGSKLVRDSLDRHELHLLWYSDLLLNNDLLLSKALVLDGPFGTPEAVYRVKWASSVRNWARILEADRRSELRTKGQSKYESHFSKGFHVETPRKVNVRLVFIDLRRIPEASKLCIYYTRKWTFVKRKNSDCRLQLVNCSLGAKCRYFINVPVIKNVS